MKRILSIIMALMLMTSVVEARRLGKIEVQGLHITEHGSILAGAGASGILTLGGVGGSNNHTAAWDFETTANTVELEISPEFYLFKSDDQAEGLAMRFNFNQVFLGNSDTGQRLIYTSNVQQNNDVFFAFGNDLDLKMVWEQSQGRDSFQIGTKVGTDENTGYISIMEEADLGSANRSPDADWVNGATPADPTFCVTSSDATEKLDHGCQWHDQTNFNTDWGIGDYHIGGSAKGDVTLFEDTTVDNAADGKKFIIHRKAAEFNERLEFYIAQNGLIKINAPTDALEISSSGSIRIDSVNSTFRIQENAGGNTTIFQFAMSGENPSLDQGGYITAASGVKDISWTISDATDNFELTREDANILAFDIQMPTTISPVGTTVATFASTATIFEADTFWVGAGTGVPYGEISFDGGLNGSTFGIEVTDIGDAGKVQVTGFNANGFSNLTTSDHTNNEIKIIQAGVYDTFLDSSASSGNNDDYETVVYVDSGSGPVDTQIHAHRSVRAGGAIGDFGDSGKLSLAVGDEVEVYLIKNSSDGVARTLTFEHIKLHLTMIGGN